MSERPTVAVVMSTYNGEAYLKEQIDSVLGQDYPVTLWVRDDGSQDQTTAILESYGQRIHWYRGENLGPAGSFLELLRHCGTYDCYAFADQDDIWLPGKISAAVEKLKDCEKPAVYFSDAQPVDGNGDPLGGTVYHHTPALDFYTICCAGGILGCTMVLNGEMGKLLCQTALPKKLIMHDFYAAQVCLALGGELIYDPVPTVRYRQHGNNAVGIAGGKAAVKDRVRKIGVKEKVSIAEQAQEVLYLYGDRMEKDKSDWLKKIIEYRRNLGKRLALALSRRTKYSSKNMGMTLRLSILAGHR